FYKQYQKFHHIDKETGEEYIETSVEDIQEANELIKEVLLRKSDSLTGACRNHLENIKIYLKLNNQLLFTNSEIRRRFRIKESTLRNYNTQLLLEGYIKKVHNKKDKSYAYEITNQSEYEDLQKVIDESLQKCMEMIKVFNQEAQTAQKQTKINKK
ncbi:hypothetical protein B0A78_10575, partial [Flavobacterium columnare NBRC 100251 = ATCC 23463]